MNQDRLRIYGAALLAAACLTLAADLSFAQSRSAAAGKLAGVVRDATGTPQMGASVEVVAETTGKAASLGLLTNTQGVFRGERLTPG